MGQSDYFWWYDYETDTMTKTNQHLQVRDFASIYDSISNNFNPHLNKLKAHYANGDSGAKHSKCLVSPTCKNAMIKNLPINGS